MRHVLTGLLAVALAAAGCTEDGDPAAPPAPPAVTTLAEGRLTACVVPGPGVAEESADGLAGYDVAVLEAVADELGLALDVVPTPLDDVVSGVALNGGACDVAAGGVVDRSALDAVVTTSAPYRTVHRQLVSVGAGPDVAAEEVNGSVGFEEGGPAAGDVDALEGADVVAYPSRADLGRALQQGAVELALVTVTDRADLEEQLGGPLVLRGLVRTAETTVLLLPLAAPADLAEAIDDALAAVATGGGLDDLVGTWLRD